MRFQETILKFLEVVFTLYPKTSNPFQFSKFSRLFSFLATKLQHKLQLHTLSRAMKWPMEQDLGALPEFS